jgi:hypothetical protein
MIFIGVGIILQIKPSFYYLINCHHGKKELELLFLSQGRVNALPWLCSTPVGIN